MRGDNEQARADAPSSATGQRLEKYRIVMKDVALGSSIVCSSLASTVLFDFELNAAFAAGIAAVIYSVFLYGQRAHCCGALTPPEN